MMFRSQILQFTEFNKILNLAFTRAKKESPETVRKLNKIKNKMKNRENVRSSCWSVWQVETVVMQQINYSNSQHVNSHISFHRVVPRPFIFSEQGLLKAKLSEMK